MHNQYFRFFFVEKPGRRWLFALFFLGFIMASLAGILSWQKGQIAIMLKKRIFIERTADMGFFLAERTPMVELVSIPFPEKTIVEIPKKEIIEVSQEDLMEIAEKERIQLQGIFLQGGRLSALINGQAYHKGQTFEGLEVADVTKNKVVLKNAETGRIINLFLPGFDWANF